MLYVQHWFIKRNVRHIALLPVGHFEKVQSPGQRDCRRRFVSVHDNTPVRRSIPGCALACIIKKSNASRRQQCAYAWLQISSVSSAACNAILKKCTIVHIHSQEQHNPSGRDKVLDIMIGYQERQVFIGTITGPTPPPPIPPVKSNGSALIPWPGQMNPLQWWRQLVPSLPPAPPLPPPHPPPLRWHVCSSCCPAFLNTWIPNRSDQPRNIDTMKEQRTCVIKFNSHTPVCNSKISHAAW